MERVGGIIQFKADGDILTAKGEFTYDLGGVQREEVVGSDQTVDYKEEPVAAFVEGAITDRQDLDMASVHAMAGVTVTLLLANGKTVVFANAVYAGDRQVSTEEGEANVKFIAQRGVEI